MGKLTVTFNGICTWIPAWAFSQFSTPIPIDPAVQWRVVLANGSNGFGYEGDRSSGLQPVPPHMAALDVSGAPIASMSGALPGVLQLTPTSWALRGVSLSVPNAHDDLKPNQLPIPEIPKLGLCAGMPEGFMIPLDGGAIGGQRSSAFFDICVGQLEPGYLTTRENQVANVTYVVDTNGPPQLSVQTFFDRTATVITFKDDIVGIIVENIGQGADTWWDWVIHYLVCTAIPRNILPPGPFPPPSDNLTSGCSNSQWP